jgi:hypothetical protein
MVHSVQIFVTAFLANRAFTSSNFGASVGSAANKGAPNPPMVCEGIDPIAEAVAEHMKAAPAAICDMEGMFSKVRPKESRRAKKPCKNSHGKIHIYERVEQQNLPSAGCLANDALFSSQPLERVCLLGTLSIVPKRGGGRGT